MIVVGVAKFNRGADGSSKIRIHFSWPKKCFASNTGTCKGYCSRAGRRAEYGAERGTSRGSKEN